MNERERDNDINRSQRKYPGIRCVYRRIDAVSLVIVATYRGRISERIGSARYQSCVLRNKRKLQKTFLTYNNNNSIHGLHVSAYTCLPTISTTSAIERTSSRKRRKRKKKMKKRRNKMKQIRVRIL